MDPRPWLARVSAIGIPLGRIAQWNNNKINIFSCDLQTYAADTRMKKSKKKSLQIYKKSLVSTALKFLVVKLVINNLI